MTGPAAPPAEQAVVSVIGCGYLGAVHAAALAKLGNLVIGVETDPERLMGLANGKAPFFEPGLDEMLAETLASGRLSFTADIAAAADATIHFICVGTPQTAGHPAADLTYLEAAFERLLTVIKPGDVVAGKSTVPVGTAPELAERLTAACPEATLLWNPEFLREGHAIDDTMRPDRVVVGSAPGAAADRALAVLRELYAPITADCPLIEVDFATAELVKVAANAFLATKISFINAMADLCEVAGADVVKLADALGHDDRIGRKFLNAGLGFGGGCLPKDIRAFMHRAMELGADQPLLFLREVDAINLRRRDKVVRMVREWLGDALVGRRIAVLGAAFKPDSDDIRDSPALAVAESLHLLGADVRVTDPRAIESARKQSPALSYVASPQEAAEDAEAVLLLTEWAEFRELEPSRFGEFVASRRILDARNCLDGAAWRKAGWEYRCLGRAVEG
ncbi:UDP-glucose dehydrogenase family protein [Nocardioides terrisoli]|uniref:UDP-glucose dehydrogenase family protein n=1 Tax=Nocardioides terrisoli TaxID=3388267 RepID=UPI00287B98C1|nr:UDP-glucose/GDP-mannose dehydrogenase family protein [Nocardioides marmorisolisilvae]